MVIEGVGPHHNKGSIEDSGKYIPPPLDANVLFHAFVDRLQNECGQTINVAKFELLGQIEYNETRIRNLYNDTIEMMKHGGENK